MVKHGNSRGALAGAVVAGSVAALALSEILFNPWSLLPHGNVHTADRHDASNLAVAQKRVQLLLETPEGSAERLQALRSLGEAFEILTPAYKYDIFMAYHEPLARVLAEILRSMEEGKAQLNAKSLTNFYNLTRLFEIDQAGRVTDLYRKLFNDTVAEVIIAEREGSSESIASAHARVGALAVILNADLDRVLQRARSRVDSKSVVK